MAPWPSHWSLQGSTFCANSKLPSACSWPQNNWRKEALGVHSTATEMAGGVHCLAWALLCIPSPYLICPVLAGEDSFRCTAHGQCVKAEPRGKEGTGSSLSQGAGCPGCLSGSGTSAELCSPGANRSWLLTAFPGGKGGSEKVGRVRGRSVGGHEASVSENMTEGLGHSPSHRK